MQQDCGVADMRRYTVFVSFIILSLIPVQAQKTRDSWMSGLEDTFKVCRISIPGTHDSGTAGVRFPMKHYAQTQTMNLSEQWDAGIRFFDLRPKLEGGKLKIYHGPANCHLTFDDALLTLKGKLQSNPTELCIVMINMAGGGQEGFDMAMREIASTIPEEMIAPFRNDMVISDLRGRIFFISRSYPTRVTDTHGALTHGWPGNSSFKSSLFSGIGPVSAALWVQDYYTSGDNDADTYLEKKWYSIKKLMNDYVAYADGDTWCINHASGYTGTGVRTNIRKCSDFINSRLEEYLKEHKEPIGIIPMDFPSQELIDAIIECNK